MRIGIDARPLSAWRAGTSRVVENIIGELGRIDRENSYYLYSDQDFVLPFRNPRWLKRITPPSHFLPGTFWLQTRARAMIVRDKLDIFWGTAHVLPLGLPANVSRVVTVLDLVWHLHPGTMALYNRCVHRLFADRSIREADRLIAISDSTAQDLVRLLEVPRSKIHVVHLAAGNSFYPHDAKTSARYIARRYDVSEDYIFTVGTIEPRKNLMTLLKAFGILRRGGDLKCQLVIAGGRGWKNWKIQETLRRSTLTETGVRCLGRVPEEDMPRLYSGASVFAFPSLYEGFGLPLVEAMACGVPIVTSNVSSMPEVVQNAALTVSPSDSGEIAEAITSIRRDPELRRCLIRKGLRRAQDFSWERSAQKVLSLFEECAAVARTN